jgi:dipeptidyl aminopeptidase/acylaminoacyl peptidase
LPAIVFLHGSVGNFKVYTWVLAELAEELGCVIIAPSFGFGMWDRPEGVGLVRDALADAGTLVTLDSGRLWLAGLSNGGLGVSQVANAMSERFRGCILVSPVISDAVANSADFQKKWAGRPMLVLTGEDDERVPVSTVRAQTESLRSGGVNVRFVTYAGEDHFLLFSRRQSVLKEIVGWLRAQNTTTPSTGVVGSGAPSSVESGRDFSG